MRKFVEQPHAIVAEILAPSLRRVEKFAARVVSKKPCRGVVVAVVKRK